MKLKEFIIDEVWWTVDDIFKDVKYFFRRHLWKLIKGYYPEDIWNLGYYFSYHIPFMLRNFIESNRCGYPCNTTQEEWEKKLQSVLYKLESIKRYESQAPDKCKEYDWEKDLKEEETAEEEFVKGWHELGDIIFKLWD
jgi:hypothetical protein